MNKLLVSPLAWMQPRRNHRATPATLQPAAAATLARLQQHPESAGERVYRGDVHPLGKPGSVSLFTYERRVLATADGSVTATHLTRDTHGKLVVVEMARCTEGYVLQHFEAAYGDAGHSGSATLVGRHSVHYTLHRGGRSFSATEKVDHPLVAGPSLHGYILAQWDALACGLVLAVRMPVLARQRSYGFTLQRVHAIAGRSAFQATPCSLLVRLALAPLRVEFDNATRNVVVYQGRVPPMQLVNGRYQVLDADVAYSQHMAAYR